VTSQDLRDTLQYLAETPQVVADAAAGLAAADLRWKPGAKEFSILENVCHLRDIETEGYAVRIRRLLAEDQPILADLQGDRLAEERRYNTQDAGAGIEAFRRARAESLQALHGATAADWERTGEFEGVGTITLRRLAGMMREHDQSHRAELARLGEHLRRARAVPDLSPSARRVQEALAAKGLACSVVELPASTRSAREAAQAIGCRAEQIVKSLVFRGQRTGRPVLVLASGTNRVDEARLSDLVSEPVEKASPDYVRERTGFAIGGVPPLGHLELLQTFIDRDLLQYAEIWAAAGTPNAVFKLAPADLEKMTGGRVVTCRQVP
jgi:prolyl-tRNA editing enzyme YbaK/EbsC (Cys-tRNA(Pro) deacylase)